MPNITCGTLSPMPEPGPGQLWQIVDIAEATGLKPQTVRWHKWRGHLPAPDQRLGRSPGWRRETIWPWIEARLAG